MSYLLDRALRELLPRLCFFLPTKRRIALDRWVRGREEHRKLRNADFVITSFGKSGRTWMRILLSRFFQLRVGMPEQTLIGFDNFHRKDAVVPRFFFTHDNYLKDYSGNADSKADFYGKKVVLLVRNPYDTAVSQYFQWKHRMRPVKKALNGYPRDGDEVALFDFVMGAFGGLPTVVDFLNLWLREAEAVGEVLIVRYEDLRADTAGELTRVLTFMEQAPNAEEVAEAVRFASVENMRNMEQKKVFWLDGRRMTPGNKNEPNSFKVRRAKVGGYRDYFSEEQLAEMEALVESRLLPGLGYLKHENACDAEGPALRQRASA